MAECEKVLLAILAELEDTNPLGLRKAELLRMRERVIKIVVAALDTGDAIPEVEMGDVDADYLQALQTVLSYGGRNRFLRDLRRNVEVYGGLTQRQAQAVLGPPTPSDQDRAAMLGIKLDTLPYRWMAQDAIAAANRRARELAEEKAKGA